MISIYCGAEGEENAALAAYSAGTADWTMVEEAFVDGWAYEYSVVNG